MSTDYRALCVELLEALENAIRVIHHEDGTRHISTADAVIAKADAALAQPEPVGPTDDELLELMPETMRDEFSYAAKVCSDATGGQVKPGIFRVCLNHTALEYARAILARWGRPAIIPIPVSERLPYDAECSDEGECWWFHAGAERWDLLPRPPLKWMEWSHWLPAHVLPLPGQPATDAAAP